MTSSEPPSSLYKLVSLFSAIQLGTGLGTVFVYQIEDARDAQFIAILYALTTFYMVYVLIPHTLQRENDPSTRLNKQFVIANFLLLCWVMSLVMVPLTVGGGLRDTIKTCAAEWFILRPMCITLGLDIVLPFAIICCLTSISWTIYCDARALHEAILAREPPPALTPFKLTPTRRTLPPRVGSTSSRPEEEQPLIAIQS